MPSALPQIQLHDVVYQQQDATVFNGAALPAIAAAPEAFLIFYLNRTDEQNGYGTVIQLDSQTKQAAIFADLNPEYSYLFYTDEQGRLQTLLWCIEFATRTAEGLFVTQAKVYGRGIEEAELKSMVATMQGGANQPQEHQLTEQVTPQLGPQATAPDQTPAPITPAPPAPMPAPAPAAAPQQPAAAQWPEPIAAPTQPTVSQMQSMSPAPPSLQTPALQPMPDMAMPELTIPTAPPLPAYTAPSPADVPATPMQPIAQQPMAAPLAWPEPVTPAAPSYPSATPAPAGLPDLSAMEPAASPSSSPIDELQLPPLPEPGLAPLPTAPPAWPNQPNQPSQPAPEPRLESSTQFSTDTSDTLSLPPLETVQPTAQPNPNHQATPMDASAMDANSAPAPQAGRLADSKGPVGRPPKPLVQDRLWMISADDFVWLKSISRQPLEPNRETLRQKVIEQIQRNQPELVNDWRFHGAFDQAFEAISLTYELVPGLRHDLLKSLLNGRVVDSVAKSLTGSAQ